MPRLATLDYDGWTTEMWAHWSLGVLLEDDKTTRQGTVTESMDGVGTDCSVCARRRNTFRQLNTRQRFPLWFYANRGPSVLLYCTAEWSRVECPFAYYDYDYYYYWLYSAEIGALQTWVLSSGSPAYSCHSSPWQ